MSLFSEAKDFVVSLNVTNYCFVISIVSNVNLFC